MWMESCSPILGPEDRTKDSNPSQYTKKNAVESLETYRFDKCEIL